MFLSLCTHCLRVSASDSRAGPEGVVSQSVSSLTHEGVAEPIWHHAPPEHRNPETEERVLTLCKTSLFSLSHRGRVRVKIKNFDNPDQNVEEFKRQETMSHTSDLKSPDSRFVVTSVTATQEVSVSVFCWFSYCFWGLQKKEVRLDRSSAELWGETLSFVLLLCLVPATVTGWCHTIRDSTEKNPVDKCSPHCCCLISCLLKWLKLKVMKNEVGP